MATEPAPSHCDKGVSMKNITTFATTVLILVVSGCQAEREVIEPVDPDYSYHDPTADHDDFAKDWKPYKPSH